MDTRWIETFQFSKDTSKSGRVLLSAKVGDVYMSRLEIDPGVITGNIYHKNMRVMCYVESGCAQFYFQQVNGEKKKNIDVEAGSQVFHIPPFVGHAVKNIGKDKAVLVFFSDKPLRSPADTFPFHLIN